MASFVVKYQKGAQSPQMENVTVCIKKDAAFFFYSSNGEPFFFLEDIHIETFDDTFPEEVTLIIPGQENVNLVFIDPTRKEEFIAALTAFLGHRCESSYT